MDTQELNLELPEDRSYYWFSQLGKSDGSCLAKYISMILQDITVKNGL